MPRLHQLLIAAVILNLVLQVSIPLGFYGFAMQIEGVVFIIITPVLLFTSRWLWRKKAIDRTTLLLGLLPPFYVAAAVLVQLSIHGIIPFHMAIYSLWQYALIVHIITVLIIAILRVRAENRQLEQKQRLARELQIEREASFHQRQFSGHGGARIPHPAGGDPGGAGESSPLGGLDQPGGALRSHWPRRHPPGAAHR